MKRVVLAVAAFAALVMVGSSVRAAENGMRSATYVESQRLLDNFGKANANPIVPGDGYEVQTNRRVKNGNIEIHVKETDIFYVMAGSATILVGGTAVEPKETRANQMTAKDMQNPQSYDLNKGDVLVIPAGTPHWFKQVNGSIDYLVVKHVKP